MELFTIRGVLLEELVLYLLEKIGYRLVRPGEDGTHDGPAGLEVQGRGEWHQVDALAAYDYSPAFMYPLRLMVEAKCYRANRPVQIGVVRNAVGVQKDISENYFTYASGRGGGADVKVQRFNFQTAIFSTSGFTEGAERYAIAHQIFLIQYQRVKLFEPVTAGLLSLELHHLAPSVQRAAFAEGDGGWTRRLRAVVRSLLRDEEPDTSEFFTEDGLFHLLGNVVTPLTAIEGSYFGMLQGKWPMHLLSNQKLPAEVFARTDSVRCKVHGRESMNWSFVPIDIPKDHPNWFQLQFDLPPEVAPLVQAARGDAVEIAHVKQENFSFITLAGRIGGVRRQVMLQLDEDWLADYLLRALRTP